MNKERREFLPEKPIPLGEISLRTWEDIISKILAPHSWYKTSNQFRKEGGFCEYFIGVGKRRVEISTSPKLNFQDKNSNPTTLNIKTSSVSVSFEDAHLAGFDIENRTVTFVNSLGVRFSLNGEGKIRLETK